MTPSEPEVLATSPQELEAKRNLKMREVFDLAFEVEASQRAALVHSLCADDTALSAEVLELLRFAVTQKLDLAQPSPDIATPIAAMLRDFAAPTSAATAAPGSHIGPWRVLSQIGSGGMGAVYKVEKRESDFLVTAALKLIRGFPSRQVVERFRHERRLLASLEHPNIARLIDGGSTDAGEPYLVMHLIEGLPLHVWRAGLPNNAITAERCAKLLQTLCLAVHFAHQRLIVHRDLKPSNILVSFDDEPTLLDFGIAKLLADSHASQDAELATAAHIMTPAYASPEQRAGLSASTLSDVYSLGLIFFELLTRTLDAKASNGTHSIPSDLRNVARMAMRSEPERRYPSAEAMAEDIARYFRGAPVIAVADSWRYRAKKFAARHRAALIASSLVTALVLTLITGFTLRLTQERDRAVLAEQHARTEAMTSALVTTFLRDLFKQADPNTAQGKNISALDLLAQGERQLNEADTGTPLAAPVRAQLNAAIGEIYTSIGEPKRSVESLRIAIALMRREPSLNPLILAATLHDFSRALEVSGSFKDAEAAAREALTLREANAPENIAEITATLNSIGVILQSDGHYLEAQKNFARAFDLLKSQPGSYPDEYTSTLHNLGWLAFQSARYTDAAPLLEQALALKLKNYGPDHQKVLSTLQILAQTRAKLGDLRGAQTIVLDLLERRKRLNGENSLLTMRAYNEVASSFQDTGSYVQAQPYYVHAVAIARQLNAGDSVDLATELNNQATLNEDRGDLDSAEQGYRQALAMRLRLFGPEHPGVARLRHNLARLLLNAEFATRSNSAANSVPDEIDALAKLSAASRQLSLPAQHPERFDSALLLARISTARGEFAAAFAGLAALSAQVNDVNFSPLRKARWHGAIAELELARGDLAAATKAVDAQISSLRRLLSNDHPSVALAHLAAAKVAYLRGDRDSAKAFASAAQPKIEAQLSPSAQAQLELRVILGR